MKKRDTESRQQMQAQIKPFVLCVLWWALTVPAFSQELLKLGPSGRPTLVMDDSGNYSVPISLYSDPHIEILVPDVTTPGWIQWNARKFRQTGTFAVYIYSFYKDDYLCRHDRIPAGHKTDPKWLKSCAALRYQRKLVSIDTRKKAVTQLEVLVMEEDGQYNPLNQKRSLLTVPSDKIDLRQPYDRISAIVSREMSRYKGMSVEKVVQSDSIVQMGNIMEVMCHATHEQAQNWIAAKLKGDPNADQLYRAACPSATPPAPASH